jgi:hypothetical protein
MNCLSGWPNPGKRKKKRKISGYAVNTLRRRKRERETSKSLDF